jgi:1,2-diacylglycerol 3-beta-glucosyltransferase
MNPLDIALILLALPVAAAAAYLLVLTLLAGVNRKPRCTGGARRLVVLVPAHNEARGIGATLLSLHGMLYPSSRWRIVVIADNCTDETAHIARWHGAEVFEREDATRRGKGYAVHHAIERLQTEPPGAWDAVVVVDADTVVAPNLLMAISNHLEAGAEAVQATYLPATAERTPRSVITEVAFTAFHVVRSEARERLGLSCGLRGNGMAFSREALAAVPHTAFSRTEDVEYGLRLALAGIRVAFAGETWVRGEMPTSDAAATVQRSRWIGGRIELVRKLVGPLLREGLLRPSATLLDLAADLYVPPLSLLVAATVAGTALAALVAAASGAFTLALLVWLGAAAAIVIHVGYAAWRAHQGAELLTAVRLLPGYVMDKCRIALAALTATDTAWVRTARRGELP